MTSIRSDGPDVSTSQSAPSSQRDAEGRTGSGGNPFLAIGLFVRQVIAELGKVHVPTRRELVGYTITVLSFVAVMILIIFGLDFAFGWLADLAFVKPDAGI